MTYCPVGVGWGYNMGHHFYMCSFKQYNAFFEVSLSDKSSQHCWEKSALAGYEFLSAMMAHFIVYIDIFMYLQEILI
jgi:hypothetical protein